MQHKPAVGLYLDTRRAIANGKFPVKVRVTWEVMATGKYTSRYYHTDQYLLPEEFSMVLEGRARSSTLKDAQEAIHKARAKAIAIIDKNNRIGPDQFLTLYKGTVSTSGLVIDLFDEIIKEKRSLEKEGTATSYEDAKASIVSYAGDKLHLSSINKEWLKKYELYCTSKGRSLNTVGFYLRALRAVFNRAIDRKMVPGDSYPFGVKGGYQIRKKRTKKKSLPLDLKDALLAYVPENNQEAAALDFVLFSYRAHGMNFADMAYLTWDNIKSDHIVFVRRKTMGTVKEQVEIKIFLSEDIHKILHRRALYKPYIFGIINENLTSVNQKKKIKQWIKTTNKWLNVIVGKLGYTERISTYSMRHTFTTILANAGVPITKIKDSLGHTSILTTQYYAEDLDLDTSKGFSDIL